MKKSGSSGRGLVGRPSSGAKGARPSGSSSETPRCRSPPKSIAPEDRNIWKFFCGILDHGRLTPEYQDHLLGTYMANFKASVTHLSVTNDVSTSLEYFEKYGDTVVNLTINWWIATMHPDLVSVSVGANKLSAIKGTKYLGIIGNQKGWRDVMIVSPDVEERLKFLASKTQAYTATKEHPEGDITMLEEYDEITEDAVEAFFGCLVMSMREDGQTFGAAIEVANNIMFWMLNTTYFGDSDVPGLDIDADLDPATTLRDLYQNKNELGWNLHKGVTSHVENFHLDEGGNAVPDAFRHVIYHWDCVKVGNTGDVMQDYTDKNRKLLYVSDWSFDEEASKKRASVEALKLLAAGKANVYDVIGQEYVLKGQADLSRKYVLQHPPKKTKAEKKWKGVYDVYIISKHGASGMKPGKKRKSKQGQCYMDEMKEMPHFIQVKVDSKPTGCSELPDRKFQPSNFSGRGGFSDRGRGGYSGRGRGGFSDRGRGGYSGRGRGGFGGRPEPFVPKKYLEE